MDSSSETMVHLQLHFWRRWKLKPVGMTHQSLSIKLLPLTLLPMSSLTLSDEYGWIRDSTIAYERHPWSTTSDWATTNTNSSQRILTWWTTGTHKIGLMHARRAFTCSDRLWPSSHSLKFNKKLMLVYFFLMMNRHTICFYVSCRTLMALGCQDFECWPFFGKYQSVLTPIIDHVKTNIKLGKS